MFNWVNSKEGNFKIWELNLKCAQLQLKALESEKTQHSFALDSFRGIYIPLKIILATQNITYLLSRWLRCYGSRQLGSLFYGIEHPLCSHHCGTMGTCSQSDHNLASSKNLVTQGFYSWQILGCKTKLSNNKEGFSRCSEQFADPLNSSQEE